MRNIVDRFEVGQGALPADFPLFPTPRGETPDKQDVVDMVEAIAAKLGLPLVGPDGRRAFGGHVFRVSGARVSRRQRERHSRDQITGAMANGRGNALYPGVTLAGAHAGLQQRVL